MSAAPTRSLWERMTSQNKSVPESPLEDRYEKPAKIRVGGVMAVNTIDYSSLVFTVQDLWQWTRTIGGKKRIITDYRIRAVPHDGEAVELLIRIIPRENPDAVNKFTHHFVVLRKFFECGWQDEPEREGILQAVNDPAGELVWQRDTPDEARFWRIHTKSPYECKVAVLRDENGDGKVDESEVDHRRYRLWDFHRETLDEAGQKMVEYLFVHQDQSAGDFEAWRGEEVDPSRIRA